VHQCSLQRHVLARHRIQRSRKRSQL